ncbi:MAG: VOC family protein [Bacillota bacterium]|nr:VOC family protein [Bacillota bacterium]
MDIKPIVLCFPIANRRISYDFYHITFGFNPIGDTAEDGIPEPLQFVINPGLRLMLIPTDGFSWVIGNNKVASPGISECILSIEVESNLEVDEIIQRALKAGANIISEPSKQEWGYTGMFSDPDGHAWEVTAI